jgi:hypothetical protein
MRRIPTIEQLRAAPHPVKLIDAVRCDLTWLRSLMTDEQHKLAVEQKLALLACREREFLEDSTVATECTP